MTDTPPHDEQPTERLPEQEAPPPREADRAAPPPVRPYRPPPSPPPAPPPAAPPPAAPPPAAPPPAAPEPFAGPSGGGPSPARAPLIVVAVLVVLLGIGAAVLLALSSLFGGDDDDDSPATDVTVTTTVEPTDEPPATTDTQPETDAVPEPRSPEGTRFARYTSAAVRYTTVLPSGAGWSEPTEDMVNDGLFRTTTRHADGLVVIVDATPGEAATFTPANRCRPADHPTIAIAERCVFTGGSLAPCRRSTCVDYLLNETDDGPGYGVLVGGGPAIQSQAIAEEVATALRQP